MPSTRCCVRPSVTTTRECDRESRVPPCRHARRREIMINRLIVFGLL